MKILLAEDDQNVLIVIKLVLERLGGHQVTVATDGEQAMQKALSEQFDLLILDGMMPKMSGLQVCQGLRQRGFASLPMIFLSAKSEESEIAEFLKYGNGYIAKPFDPQTICQRIEQILSTLRNQAS